jgi:hypothetical protein
VVARTEVYEKEGTMPTPKEVRQRLVALDAQFDQLTPFWSGRNRSLYRDPDAKGNYVMRDRQTETYLRITHRGVIEDMTGQPVTNDDALAICTCFTVAGITEMHSRVMRWWQDQNRDR